LTTLYEEDNKTHLRVLSKVRVKSMEKRIK